MGGLRLRLRRCDVVHRQVGTGLVEGVHPPGAAGSPSGAFSNRRASAALISTWRTRKARSSSRLRRSQPVTSSLHLLALQEPQAGAMLSSV